MLVLLRSHLCISVAPDPLKTCSGLRFDADADSPLLLPIFLLHVSLPPRPLLCVCLCYPRSATAVAGIQTDWASIGLVDMFNAGGAIVSETIRNAPAAVVVNGGEVGDSTSVDVMVSF